VTVIENFNQGLLITGVGMGLVFLTLLVVMALIFSLDRLFRPSEDRECQETAGMTAVEEMAPDLRSAGQEVTVDPVDQAAAVAVALALEEERRTGARDVEALPADVIMVNDIAVGSGAWRGQGRLTAMR
jgi:Na+-transporting methylmalonyl-CoA/oxaloacetate decarboxylase gamma subunit